MPRRRLASRQLAPPAPPAPYAALDAELGPLARSVGLIGAATPEDAEVERARLLSDYARGRERLPVWTYAVATAAHAHRLRRLDALAASLQALDGAPLGPLYRARADELRLELEAALAVGTSGFAELARARFSPGDAVPGAAADALAVRWCAEGDDAGPSDDPPRLASDDRDRRSLVSRLRAEVARRELPFAVRTSPSMSALAAVSGDVLWVAEGRLLSQEDVERTVVHEVDAHVIPRTRARSLSPGLFAIGTARGTDDQEGYALWLEDRRGLSGPGRKRELGARHRAVSMMRDGADFVAVVRALRAGGTVLDVALRIAERAFRGSHGATPGLGREQVYLDAYLRVRAHLSARPEDESVLSAGQVALDAVPALREWCAL